jgi:tetratricopeptide (TPR) repeat protein
MARQSTPLAASQRTAISVTFILALALVGVLFARSRSNQPEAPAPLSEQEAAARAHEAAGVKIGSQVGAVAPGFQARLHDAQAALAADSSNVELLLNLAHLYDDGHRPADAVPLYRRVIEIRPGEAMPHFDLAGALVELQEFDEATSVLEEWLRQEPSDVRALFNLGAVRANAGDPQGARTWFQRVIDESSDTGLITQAQQAILRLEGLR